MKDKKLLTYFKEGKYWICCSQKLKIVGYGTSKQEAYRLFMVSWNYVITEYNHEISKTRRNSKQS
jgi:hypothetical protein